MRVCVCVCVCVFAFDVTSPPPHPSYKHSHTPMTYMHTYIHTYTHIHTHTYRVTIHGAPLLRVAALLTGDLPPLIQVTQIRMQHSPHLQPTG